MLLFGAFAAVAGRHWGWGGGRFWRGVGGYFPAIGNHFWFFCRGSEFLASASFRVEAAC